MITVKKFNIDTTKNTDELLSRLTWQTHFVENLIFAKTSAFSVDTNKPLIGKIDKMNKQFDLSRIRPLLQNFLPQILINGQLIIKENKTELKLRYKLGLLTSAFFLFLIYTTGQVIWQMVNELKNEDEIWNGIIWLLIFPIGAVILTLYEMNKLTNKILEVLEIS